MMTEVEKKDYQQLINLLKTNEEKVGKEVLMQRYSSAYNHLKEQLKNCIIYQFRRCIFELHLDSTGFSDNDIAVLQSFSTKKCMEAVHAVFYQYSFSDFCRILEEFKQQFLSQYQLLKKNIV